MLVCLAYKGVVLGVPPLAYALHDDVYKRHLRVRSHPIMRTVFILLVPLVYAFDACRPPMRYDVRTFPPKCIMCPTNITANRLNLSRVETRRYSRATPVKFSPGLPQNQTCGCWRGGGMTVDVEVPSSPWVVAGLSFPSFTHAQWIQSLSVSASDNGTDFLDWGVYTQANHTCATIVFPLPVRARYFRLNVVRYVNHLINDTAGFPLLPVYALVANTTTSDPFVCTCPTLPDGSCCPDMNMAVRGGVCVRCVDPRTDVHAVFREGCGRCVPGTAEVLVRGDPRCIPVPVLPASVNSFAIADPVSDGMTWSAAMNVTTADNNLVAVFVEGNARPSICVVDEPVHWLVWDFDFISSSYCMLPRLISQRQLEPQYIQFDRGRYMLRFNESGIRSVVGNDNCEGWKCTMSIRAVFVSVFDGGVMVISSSVRQSVVFDLAVPELILCFGRKIKPPAVELHWYHGNDEYRILLAGVSDLSGYEIQFDADDANTRGVTAAGTLSSPPPAEWQQLRLLSPDGTVFTSTSAAVAQYDSLFLARPEETTKVSIAYGLSMSAAPQAGDSEQIVTIRSTSTQPVRLKRLTASDGMVYTNTKGFIMAPDVALDLVVSCATGGDQDLWLMAAMGMLPPTPGPVSIFARDACAWVGGGQNRKALWVIPSRVGSRRQVVNVTFSAEFG